MSKDALDGWRVDGKITATEQATQPGDVPILDSTGKIPDELINAVEVDDFYTESTDDDAVTMDENKVWRLNGWEGLEERVGDAENDIDGLSTRMGTAETALNAKQAKLTFDSAPTAGSTNPVKSGGVYTALDAKASKAEVALKADKTELALKADKTEVALKADKTELALKADKTAVNDGLALKADITYVDTEIAGIDIAPPIATYEEAIAGVDDTKMMTPLKVFNFMIQFLAPVDCAELLRYKRDTSITVTPLINAGCCTTFYEMFVGCTNLTTVGYIHCPNATNMNNMFANCSSLTTIPILITSRVTNMFGMFYYCRSLTTIPTLDISSVTDMGKMFHGCSSLTTVTFQCSNVRTYGTNMFYGTPIASGNGRIYVPDNLVQAYKTASGWSAHASVIFGHSDKP